jgi:Ca-activated chloride channel family protein
MFRFAHPEYLYALYAVPVFILLFWFLLRKRKKLLGNFANKDLQKLLLPNYSRVKNSFKFGIIIIVFILLVVAAANPQVGTKMEEVKQSGIDVYILLDVSLSMKAEDIKPNRLDRAKFQIANLIQKLRGDRIGLIIFAGEAFVQFPLTSDYSAANLFLNAVDVNSIPEQGTAIASAINLAVKSFDYRTSTQKAIVVITDGEDHEGDITQAVKDAVAKDIKIYTIGLGSPDGVPIPLYDQNGNQTGFKKDRDGNVVLTKLNPAVLQEIATEGNGKYFQGSNYEDQLNEIYKDLSKLEKTEFGVKKVTDYEDRFYYFLIPALFLLVLEFFISERKSPWFSKINQRLGLEK